MDLDQLNCASDEEMDMFMMMQMDKLSELCGDMTELPSIPYTTTSADNGTSSSRNTTNNISFTNNTSMFNNAATSDGMMMRGVNVYSTPSEKRNSMAAMREMIFRIAAMQPIHIDPESVKPPKRRNVKISKDPQSVAARHRRERISERIRILQRLVPGGTKMDTASMLDEAIHYVKFLKTQVQSLERAAGNNNNNNRVGGGGGYPVGIVVNNGGGGSGGGAYHVPHNVQHHQHYTTNV